MILILCPNLCLDRIVVVRDFAAGRIHRAETVSVLASGKGLNVARVARVLGAPVTVIGVIGTDENGRAILRGARTHGIVMRVVRVRGPSRVCTLIIDPGKTETVVNEPGPARGVGVQAKLLSALRGGLRRARVLVLAGSLPALLGEDFYARAIRLARAAGVRTVLDAAGGPLRRGLAARPDFVKVNRAELLDAIGGGVDSEDAVFTAARGLQAQTGGQVLVTSGEAGATLITSEGRWHLSPPTVTRVSAIGAGDSLTAGLVVGLLRGQSALDAARAGVAASACDVTTLLPGTIDAAQTRALSSQVAVTVAKGVR
ncbi:MAG TPA: hexose kinase [bacterium]|nr:hexose kinase [bacterium]